MMTIEMHECELHLAQVFSQIWDDAYVLYGKEALGELDEAFFEAVYKGANAQCSTFDNFDVQFDTIDTCLKMMPKNAPLSGMAYCVIVAYQIEEQTFGFSVYYGEARKLDDSIHQGKYADVACIMSANEDQKEDHMLEHFAQLKYIGL
jgi:hypothetical protein